MRTEKPVYLDHNATTPVSEEVRRVLPVLAEAWGNPSSIHQAGRDPKALIRETRKDLSAMIGCHPLEIVFTSGGSEANNTVLQFLWRELGSRRPHFMCSAVEHPSVFRTMKYLETCGADVDFIPVDRQGKIDLNFYRSRLSERTAVVSVMAANNETGTLFPIREMAALAHEKGALFHTDAVQMFGKLEFNLQEWGVDYASVSAHKFYSLKGTGVLYAKKGAPLGSLIHGGGQERHRRGGTENTPGIAALGVAIRNAPALSGESERQTRLRDHFEARVTTEIPDSLVTAGESPRLPNTSSLVIRGADGETMLMSLDLKGFLVSTGAACASGNPEPSPVLLAMGLSRQEAQNSLRVSVGRGTTLEQVDQFVEVLKQVVQRLRALAPESEVHRAE